MRNVLVHPSDDRHALRREFEAALNSRFGSDELTLQVDYAEKERLLTISLL